MIRLYSVKDKLIGFGKPFEAENDAAAVRLYKRALDDQRSDLHASPEDYSLYFLTSFDSSSGRFCACSDPILLAHSDSQCQLFLDTEV